MAKKTNGKCATCASYVPFYSKGDCYFYSWRDGVCSAYCKKTFRFDSCDEFKKQSLTPKITVQDIDRALSDVQYILNYFNNCN